MVVLSLGDFTFTRLEIPASINIGGEQKLVIHELVGGTRVVDVMGKVDDPVQWSGLLFGDGALDKAIALNNMRKQGKVLELKWSTIRYSVVIQKFTCDFQQVYKLPYSITCVIVADPSDQKVTIKAVDVTKALQDDLGTAIDGILPKCITTPPPTKGVDTVKNPSEPGWSDKLKALGSKLQSQIRSVMNNVTKIENAALSDLKNIKDTIQNIQNEVTLQLSAMTNFLQTVTTLGGLLPNNTLSRNVAKVTASAAAINNAYQLTNLQYTITHMNNLMNSATNAVPTGPVALTASQQPISSNTNLLATETVMGGDLYKIAAKYYGDVTKWNVIAKANGLTSPTITSPITLVIPRIS